MADDTEPSSRLEALLGRARLVIGFERLWPAVVLAGVVVSLFFAASWLGLWIVVPGWARVVGVAAFAAALAAPLMMAVRGRRVSRTDAMTRLDRDSGQQHRPVSASQDRLADPDADPLTQALWALHRRRAAAAAAAVRLAPPSPRLVDRDFYAVRGIALVALAAAAFVAGADKEGRVASAFAWRAAVPAGPGFRLDAWIDPPAYTGRAPILLSGLIGADPQPPTSVPVHSTVVIRSSGEGRVEMTTDGGLKPASPPVAAAAKALPDGPKPDAGSGEHRFVLAGDGHLAITLDDARRASFDLRAIPDLAPTVTVPDKPKSNLRGSMTLGYRIEDDYGVVGAEAAFSAPVLDGKPVTGRILVEAPKVPLSLPNGARGLGLGQTTVDLSANPWAGAEATLIVGARDEGGNVGFSAPMSVRMPMRPFHKPLARALVEQRRNLVFDPDHKDMVGEALDALTIAPELFGTTPAVFLGLTAAHTRLGAARSDADLVGVADLLWSMALSIEDGDLSQTERDLRALQRELKEALARNAPPEEIKRLTEALKQQMEKFLAEMAQRNAETRNEDAPPDRTAKAITQKDLRALLDKMEQSARNGDTAEAEQLLEQLQNILENLRSAQRGEGSDRNARQMNKSMSQLDKMMRDQQALRDKTFKRGNRNRRSSRNQEMNGEQDPAGDAGDQPQSGEDDQSGEAQDNSDLQGQQQQLRDALQTLQKQMRELGLSGEQGFGEAEQAMKDAEGALGQGAAGNDQAVEAQGRALQGLQQGARGLQNQMAQAQGEGNGDGQMPGQSGIGRADGVGRDGTDPLGRERNRQNRSLDAQGGLDAGEGLAERARQVLEELRRRLGDRLRPQEEQDYLERLLKRY